MDIHGCRIALRGVLAGAALALLPGAGSASTIPATLTGPTDLTTGEAASFLLTWGDSRPSDWTNYTSSAQIRVNGVVVEDFSLAPAGGTLPFATELSEPGIYDVEATGFISYTEQVWTVLYMTTYSYRCGSRWARRTCYGSMPVYGWRTESRGAVTLDEALTVTVSAAPQRVPSPVPLPAAMPLLFAGLGLFGLLGGWRQRRAGTG